jgi:hypothetical protein
MAQLKQQWQSDTELKPKYQIVSDNGEETVSITHVVHTIRMGDVEDPDLFVAQPIYEWQQTEAGKWIMENSNPAPSWHRQVDYTTYGQLYLIKAYLTHKQLTFWKLKYE